MEDRINVYQADPKSYEPLIALEKYVASTGLDRKLYHLIKMRASQINGCHYCINMHSRDALKLGETAQRLFLLDAWRETDLYTPKERAVLALTEAMTNIAGTHVPDDVYNEAAKQLTEKELVAVIMGICAINSWNRIAIATHQPLD